MARQKGVEIDGKRYVGTKTAAGWWNVKGATVASYCKDGLVPGAFKDSANNWCIPVGAHKPLQKAMLRRLLQLTLQLKNNPQNDIDFSALCIKAEQLLDTYRYLEQLQLVTLPNAAAANEVPYRARLTQKGTDLVFGDTQPPKKGRGAVSLDITKTGLELAKIVLAFAQMTPQP